MTPAVADPSQLEVALFELEDVDRCLGEVMDSVAAGTFAPVDLTLEAEVLRTIAAELSRVASVLNGTAKPAGLSAARFRAPAATEPEARSAPRSAT